VIVSAAHGRADDLTRRSPGWLLPVVGLCAVLLVLHVSRGGLAGDFRGTVWEPAHAVLEGQMPYPEPDSDRVRTNPSVYLPAVYLSAIPLTWLPFSVGALLFSLGLAACALATPMLLGVRDRRCLALWMLSLPVVGSVLWGNPTPVGLLLVAAAWRWRHTRWHPLLLGAAIVVKPFLWPLLLWPFMAGRAKAFVGALAAAVLLTLGPWAAIGFDGLSSYPSLLRSIAEVHGDSGVFAYAIAERSGLTFLALLAGLALIALAWRRGERTTLAFLLVAALVLSPLAWSHYFGLLVIIIGVHRPRLDAWWLVFPGLWVLAAAQTGEPRPLVLIAFAILLVGWCLARLVWADERRLSEAPHAADHTAGPAAGPAT